MTQQPPKAAEHQEPSTPGSEKSVEIAKSVIPHTGSPDAGSPDARTTDTEKENSTRDQAKAPADPTPDPTRYGDWEKNGRCIDF